MKKKLLVLIFTVVLLIAVILFLEYRYYPGGRLGQDYIVPKDSSCDFSNYRDCLRNGCQWRYLTDVANQDPMPVTCCPIDAEPNGSINPSDPCAWGPFP